MENKDSFPVDFLYHMKNIIEMKYKTDMTYDTSNMYYLSLIQIVQLDTLRHIYLFHLIYNTLRNLNENHRIHIYHILFHSSFYNHQNMVNINLIFYFKKNHEDKYIPHVSANSYSFNHIFNK